MPARGRSPWRARCSGCCSRRWTRPSSRPPGPRSSSDLASSRRSTCGSPPRTWWLRRCSCRSTASSPTCSGDAACCWSAIVHLPRRLAAVRHLADHRAAHRLPRGAGPGLGGAVHQRVRGRRGHLPARRARQVPGHLRRGVRPLQRGRAARRRLHHRPLRLALGVLRQPAHRRVALALHLRQDAAAAAGGREARSSTSRARSLLAVGVVPLLLALRSGERGGGPAAHWVPVGLAADPGAVRARARSGSGCSSLVERRARRSHPRPVALFRNRGRSRSGNAAAFVIGGAFLARDRLPAAVHGERGGALRHRSGPHHHAADARAIVAGNVPSGQLVVAHRPLQAAHARLAG